MNRVLVKLFDATLETISRPLASSLKKGGASYPKFRQAIINMGQVYHDNPVDEEQAMQTAARYLVHFAMLGAAWTTIYYQVNGYFDRQKRRTLVAYQEVKQCNQEASKKIEEYKQEHRKLVQEIQDFRLRVLGGNASKTADGAKA